MRRRLSDHSLKIARQARRCVSMLRKPLPALYTRFVKRPNDADEWSVTAVRQLGLPFDATPHLVADEYLRGRRGPLPVRFARHGRARRYVLRVDREGVARVTMP